MDFLLSIGWNLINNFPSCSSTHSFALHHPPDKNQPTKRTFLETNFYQLFSAFLEMTSICSSFIPFCLLQCFSFVFNFFCGVVCCSLWERRGMILIFLPLNLLLFNDDQISYFSMIKSPSFQWWLNLLLFQRWSNLLPFNDDRISYFSIMIRLGNHTLKSDDPKRFFYQIASHKSPD